MGCEDEFPEFDVDNDCEDTKKFRDSSANCANCCWETWVVEREPPQLGIYLICLFTCWMASWALQGVFAECCIAPAKVFVGG
jgi:hypothetical protein